MVTSMSREDIWTDNRIESRLSLGTIVIEANIKSGSMHTANFTLKQKRALACLNINKSGNKFLLKKRDVQINIVILFSKHITTNN